MSSRNQREPVSAQITELLNRAGERPAPDDPMGTVGLGYTLLAARMWTVSQKSWMAEDQAREEFLGLLEWRKERLVGGNGEPQPV